MTATTTLPAIPVASGSHRDGDCIVLRDISWERYIELRDDPAQTRIRMTYHHGVLELMSPSGPHEKIKRLLEQLIDAWCEVHKIRAIPFGSTTYRDEGAEAGLEPDSCYYVQNATVIGDKEDLDLEVDPPPDLAIEVDITRNSVGRLPIYADLGVPEIWRTNGDWFRIYRLVNQGYIEVSQSEVFPDLPMIDFVRFLRERKAFELTSLVPEFRIWAAAQKPSAGSDA